MESEKIDPKFNKYQNPKIGLIALASDYMIEKDFIKIIKDKEIDFKDEYVGRRINNTYLFGSRLIKPSLD